MKEVKKLGFMERDNYFEEALKVRNLLEEFYRDHGVRPPTILGVREHVFTGSVASLASFMSNQESSFVTLGQRVLANPLKVRMHYGHPDVFDRLFHITRGGISKASRVINISEDIFSEFGKYTILTACKSLLNGNVTHHEYLQVGKGRDVGLNQILCLRGKLQVVTGNKSLVEMSTGLVSFLISSECYRSTSQLWDTTFAPWHYLGLVKRFKKEQIYLIILH
ncbi:unnamed protein product [Cuscuta campestris]|uniref:Glycosyl transferase 48 domain-containing protein n=1 Tax=Cuscuta campestris TaxID=132261 RepID=A0A484KAE7_9ASTE|nr:unnamed protein product [Cuscuta campestris]